MPGKRGNIRRLTERMDPRGYEVIRFPRPNDVEKDHHYLWRFWTEFPKAGHVTILTAPGMVGCWWNAWRAFAVKPNGSRPTGKSMRWKRI